MSTQENKLKVDNEQQKTPALEQGSTRLNEYNDEAIDDDNKNLNEYLLDDSSQPGTAYEDDLSLIESPTNYTYDYNYDDDIGNNGK